MLTLKVLNGNEKGQEFALNGQLPESIGRDVDYVSLHDSRISRLHCEIKAEDDQWLISDLGSRNGTFVNSKKITESTPLQEGDELQIGRLRVQVAEISAKAGEPAPGSVTGLEDAEEAQPQAEVKDEEEDGSIEPIPVEGDAQDHDKGNQEQAGEALEDSPLSDSPQVNSVGTEEKPKSSYAQDNLKPTDGEDSSASDADAHQPAEDEAEDVAAQALGLEDESSPQSAEAPPAEPPPLTDKEAEAGDDRAKRGKPNFPTPQPYVASPKSSKNQTPLQHEEQQDDDPAHVLNDASESSEEAKPEPKPSEPAEIELASPPEQGQGEDADDNEVEQTQSVAGSRARSSLDASSPTIEPIPAETDETSDQSSQPPQQTTPHPGANAPTEPATPASAQPSSGGASSTDDEDEDEDDDALRFIDDALAELDAEPQSDQASEPEHTSNQSVDPIEQSISTESTAKPRTERSVDSKTDTHGPAEKASEASQAGSGRRKARVGRAIGMIGLALVVGTGLWIFAFQPMLADQPVTGKNASKPISQSSPQVAGDQDVSSTHSVKAETDSRVQTKAGPTPNNAAGQPSAKTSSSPDSASNTGRLLSDGPSLTGGSVLKDRLRSDSPGVGSGSSDGTPARRAQSRPPTAGSDAGGQSQTAIAQSTQSSDKKPPTTAQNPHANPPPNTTQKPTSTTPEQFQKRASKSTSSTSEPQTSGLPRLDWSSSVMGWPGTTDEPNQRRPEDAQPKAKAANSNNGQIGPSPGPQPRTPIEALPQARRIAFLLDGSGSMIDTMPAMIDWFEHALDQLQADQQITTIIFRRHQAVEVDQSGLHPATAENKGRIKRWMRNQTSQVQAQGRSGIKEALNLALSYDVKTLYLLADDDFASHHPDQQTRPIVGQLNQALAGRDITVHTVQFLHDDPDHVLQSIAGRFGGTYQFISPELPNSDQADRLSSLTDVVTPE